MVTDSAYLPGLGKCDHIQISFTFTCYTEIAQQFLKKYNFFKGNYNAMVAELNKTERHQQLQNLTLIESWDTLTDILNKLIEINIPESKTSLEAAKRRPYVNQKCLDSIRTKHTKWTKYKHSMTDRNYNNYKIARNKVKSDLRKAKYEYEKDIATRIKTDSKNSSRVMFVPK